MSLRLRHYTLDGITKVTKREAHVFTPRRPQRVVKPLVAILVSESDDDAQCRRYVYFHQYQKVSAVFIERLYGLPMSSNR